MTEKLQNGSSAKRFRFLGKCQQRRNRENGGISQEAFALSLRLVIRILLSSPQSDPRQYPSIPDRHAAASDRVREHALALKPKEQKSDHQ
jgi:hypothetical protein